MIPVTRCGLALLAPTPGCGGRSNPVSPRPPTAPTLVNLWPDADGSGWTYRLTQRSWQDTAFRYYPSESAVPAAPTMTTLATVADSQPVGPGLSSGANQYTLRFAGLVTTGAGVTAQQLDGVLGPCPAPARAGAAALARLARARPDLAARLGLPAASVRAGPATSPADFPTFLHEGAWRRDTAWIGTYSDLDTVPSFHFLRSSLAPGTEYAMPMYPSLAPDVVLHARVLPSRRVVTPAGVFTNTVVVLYRID